MHWRNYAPTKTLAYKLGDKGDATVIVDTTDYNTDTYKLCIVVPRTRVQRRTEILLKAINGNEKLIKEFTLWSQTSTTIWLVYKDNAPLSPIFSTIGNRAYKLARHLAEATGAQWQSIPWTSWTFCNCWTTTSLLKLSLYLSYTWLSHTSSGMNNSTNKKMMSRWVAHCSGEFLWNFEKEALLSAAKKPKCWLRYMTDSFIF